MILGLPGSNGEDGLPGDRNFLLVLNNLPIYKNFNNDVFNSMIVFFDSASFFHESETKFH